MGLACHRHVHPRVGPHSIATAVGQARRNSHRATGCGLTVLPVLSRRGPWRTVLGWLGLLVAAAAVVVAGVYVVFWLVSDLIARHDVGAITGPHRAVALQVARDAARGRLLTFGAGLFAAGALVYTARNFTLSRRTYELTEQGHVTDRYTKAIEQLGSDKLDVRIGGIYALERVARDSARDHPTVMEVLTAFVREHSRDQWQFSAEDAPADDVHKLTTRPDVQAGLNVIRRRDSGHDRDHLDLSGAILGIFANLNGANLNRALLVRAKLTAANLSGSNLSGANLVRTHLFSADLTGADLTGANVYDANLIGATLSSANLTGAFLARADLTDADLTGADLTRADLTDTDLTGADLTGADLTGANLTGALWPPDAVVPEGWQRDTDSGGLNRIGTDSDDGPTD